MKMARAEHDATLPSTVCRFVSAVCQRIHSWKDIYVDMTIYPPTVSIIIFKLKYDWQKYYNNFVFHNDTEWEWFRNLL